MTPLKYLNKNIASLFLGLAFILAIIFASPAASFSDPTLTVGSVSGSSGTDVDLPVTLNSGTASVASFQFNLTLSPSLSVVSVVAGASAVAAGKNVAYNFLPPSELRVMVFGMNNYVISSGQVAIVKLHIAPNTPLGPIAVPIWGVVFSDPGGMGIPSGANMNGSVTVGFAVCCPGACQQNSTDGWHQSYPVPSCGQTQYRIQVGGPSCSSCNFFTYSATQACK